LLETVSLSDLTPTIVELAGFQPPGDLDGRSVADAITGKRVSAPDTGTAFAAMIKDRSNPGGMTAVSRGHWKLVNDNAALELYDLRADPGEHDNAIARFPQIAGELSALLAAHAARAEQSPFP
jgi:arylsulfatase A-like enzyme